MRKSSITVGVLFLLLGIISCEQETYYQGRLLYEDYCQNCHMNDGTGLKGVIPPLKNSDYLKNNQQMLTCLIRRGISDTLTVNGKQYSQPMPGNTNLTQGDIANIINYINQAWDNDYGTVLYEDVLRQFESCR